MKTLKSVALLACAALAMGMWSCSDDDDDIQASSVPTVVNAAFTKMFPNASAVQWERYLQYYVADFSNNTFDTEAWYNADGSWAMTETDYDSLVTMLPMEVQDSFNDSQYSSWIVDDAKYFQRNLSESFCVIEVETDGMPEIALFYDTFGNLVNKVQGDDFDITPTTNITTIVWQ